MRKWLVFVVGLVCKNGCCLHVSVCSGEVWLKKEECISLIVWLKYACIVCYDI